MFSRSLAADIVIGNMYISVERFAGTPIQEKWKDSFRHMLRVEMSIAFMNATSYRHGGLLLHLVK